jgi:hypothetical protein
VKERVVNSELLVENNNKACPFRVPSVCLSLSGGPFKGTIREDKTDDR